MIWVQTAWTSTYITEILLEKQLQQQQKLILKKNISRRQNQGK